MQNSSKFAHDYHAKLPTFAGRNNCKCRQKNPQSHAKIPAIAGGNTLQRHLQVILPAQQFTCQFYSVVDSCAQFANFYEFETF